MALNSAWKFSLDLGVHRYTKILQGIFVLYRSLCLSSSLALPFSLVFQRLLASSLGLTWRDMQHLTVLTSKRNQLHDEVHQWRRNGVGLEFNHLFGYGVLDAGAMVKMAKDWKTVPERFHCVGGSVQDPE